MSRVLIFVSVHRGVGISGPRSLLGEGVGMSGPRFLPGGRYLGWSRYARGLDTPGEGIL